MKYDIDSPECAAVADASAIEATIIYEDFAGGLRAKIFAERLAEQLGCACHFSETFWRSDLLECPPIAAEAIRAAEDSDYLIVALRGDRILPFFTRQWIERQLDRAAASGASLIVLPGCDQGTHGVVEATRRHFRSLCARKGVAFFSHAMMPPVADAPAGLRDEEKADDLAYPAPRWTPGWTLSENHHDLRHELIQQH